MSTLIKLILKLQGYSFSDLINGFIGTFGAAPHLLAAGGIDPAQEALRNLLQGLTGILLMFCTKWVTQYFQKPKAAPRRRDIPLEPARPLKLTKPTPKNEESSQEAHHAQASNQEESNN